MSMCARTHTRITLPTQTKSESLRTPLRLVPFLRYLNDRLLSFQSESPAEKKLLSDTGACIPPLLDLLRFTSSDEESESDESRCLFFFLDLSFFFFFFLLPPSASVVFKVLIPVIAISLLSVL